MVERVIDARAAAGDGERSASRLAGRHAVLSSPPRLASPPPKLISFDPASSRPRTPGLRGVSSVALLRQPLEDDWAHAPGPIMVLPPRSALTRLLREGSHNPLLEGLHVTAELDGALDAGLWMRTAALSQPGDRDRAGAGRQTWSRRKKPLRQRGPSGEECDALLTRAAPGGPGPAHVLRMHDCLAAELQQSSPDGAPVAATAPLRARRAPYVLLDPSLRPARAVVLVATPAAAASSPASSDDEGLDVRAGGRVAAAGAPRQARSQPRSRSLAVLASPARVAAPVHSVAVGDVRAGIARLCCHELNVYVCVSVCLSAESQRDYLLACGGCVHTCVPMALRPPSHCWRLPRAAQIALPLLAGGVLRGVNGQALTTLVLDPRGAATAALYSPMRGVPLTAFAFDGASARRRPATTAFSLRPLPGSHTVTVSA